MTNARTPPPDAPFQRELLSRVDEFDGLARAFEDWGTSLGVPARILQGIVLILDELFANVVMHGYRDSPDGMVLVEASLQAGEVQVTITDHAPHFDPTQAPEPDTSLDIEEREIGGLGLLFVRRTADTLAYQPHDAEGKSANVVSFSKRLA